MVAKCEQLMAQKDENYDNEQDPNLTVRSQSEIHEAQK